VVGGATHRPITDDAAAAVGGAVGDWLDAGVRLRCVAGARLAGRAEQRATCMVPRRHGKGRRFTKDELDVMAFGLFRLDYPDDVVRLMLAAPGVDPANLL
jgi:hypothetical protein